MEDINVLYYSCPFDLSGYATVARNHLDKLSKIKNIKLRLRTRRFWNGVSPDLRDLGDRLHEMERNPISDKDFIFIQHLTPENFFIDPRAKYHICYTPFETDGAPGGWLLGLRAMDEIWVPSDRNKLSYIRAGINPKDIKVIPHGVDVSKYNLEVKSLDYNREAFNVGSVFDWTERKNPNALIRAYYNAFSNNEHVSLTIRTFWRFPIEKTKEYVYSEIQKIKDSYPGRKEFPKVLFWFDTLEEEIMPNFYRSMDCFVLPTRGEGFGLPLLEAMACGVPTIGPAWGGNTQFMNASNSILVPGNVVPINDQRFLKYQPQYTNQGWFDINEQELTRAIRWVYENKDESLEMARNAVEGIKNNFTWDNAAEKIHKRLAEISGGG